MKIAMVCGKYTVTMRHVYNQMKSHNDYSIGLKCY